jgi:hypothetical protein
MKYKPCPHLYLVLLGVGFSLFSIQQLLSLDYLLASEFAVAIALLVGTLIALTAFEHIRTTTRIKRI